MSTAPEGRRMLRLEVRNAQTPIERKPEWIKTRAKMGPEYRALQSLVKSEDLHTVCQEAGCPNIYECWEDREATFLIGGSQCTRRCDFCQIDTGKPADYDVDEPRRVAESVVRMQLRYSTVTGVARDDLPDEGAWLYAETIREIHRQSPGTGVEILVPDFSGNPDHLGEVFSARPEVFAHNVETVPRIFKRIRPAFRYERSLDVITQGRDAGLITKSNLILGMGEERDRDLAGAARPARRRHRHHHHHPVPAAESAPPARSTVGCGPRSSSSSRPRPRRSASSACSRVRSCVRRTGRDVSGPSRCTPRVSHSPTSSRTSQMRRWGSRKQSDDRTAVRLGTRVLARSERALRAGILDTMARTKDASKAQKEPGRLKQMWQVFQMTRRYDPKSQWLMLAAFLAPVLIGVGLALWFSEGNGFTIALWVIAGVLAGLLLALVVLGRRAERAAYSQIEGQPGAVGAVLRSGLRGGWVGNEMPVAVNGKTQDAIYRAVGRGGVALISEGPLSRTKRMLDDEMRKVAARAAERADLAHLGRHRRGFDRAPPTPPCAALDQEVAHEARSARGVEPPQLAADAAPDPEGHRPDEGPPAARQGPLTRVTSHATSVMQTRRMSRRRLCADQHRAGELVVEPALV